MGADKKNAAGVWKVNTVKEGKSAEEIIDVLKSCVNAARITDVCIGEQKEWHTCMVISDNQYKVSFVERGHDVKPELFESPVNAGLRTIERSDCSELKKLRTKRQIMKGI